MARILVTEKIAQPGLDRLAEAGHEVDIRTGLSAEELLEVMPGAHALIVRSATTVTAEVLRAGTDLMVVGRAGVGLDNVDVDAATSQGVMVVNAPTSNIVSAAEHSMALMLSMARNIPQAHGALKAGRWERSKWTGVELADKTLGILGFGRIGKLVAQRAQGFGMRLLAYDPYVSEERARQANVELVALEELMARADFVTLHLAKTPETIGLIGRDLLAKAKPGIRIINVARGGIIDEAALAEAVAAGTVAGAALDVFATEPCVDSPLFGLDQVVATPHLGASTVEAQDKAGEVIADMVLLALAGDFVPFAANIDAAEAAAVQRPFLGLAEWLGRCFAGLVERLPEVVEIGCHGEIGQYDTRILTLAVQRGLFSVGSDDPVTFVNAPAHAAARGVAINVATPPEHPDYVNLLTISGAGRSVGATLAGPRNTAKLVQIDDHGVEIAPSEHLLVVQNEDIPGRIGFLGSILGEAGINIHDMSVSREPGGQRATMVVATDVAVPAEVRDAIRSGEGILEVQAVSVGSAHAG